jgi:hypothetical protein
MDISQSLALRVMRGLRGVQVVHHEQEAEALENGGLAGTVPVVHGCCVPRPR